MNSNRTIQKSMPGFEHIRKHWSDAHNAVVAIIEPGQFYVTQHSEVIMTTLGSCISACIRDPINAVGGMNHFMLPIKGNVYEKKSSHFDGALRYGNWAMEFLINQILKSGGKRRNLEVKLFGAGGTFESREVCDLNIKFITEYIHDENLKLVSKDLGGPNARMIVYHSLTGKALLKSLSVKPTGLENAEKGYKRTIEKSQNTSEIELF